YEWLLKTHPRTAIQNLHVLFEEPPLPEGTEWDASLTKPHGYWKDLLDILSLRAMPDSHFPEETPQILPLIFRPMASERKMYQKRTGKVKKVKGSRKGKSSTPSENIRAPRKRAERFEKCLPKDLTEEQRKEVIRGHKYHHAYID